MTGPRSTVRPRERHGTYTADTKLRGFAADLLGTVPATLALVHATASSPSYPLPSFVGPVVVGTALHIASGAVALPLFLLAVAWGAPRRRTRESDRTEDWTAHILGTLVAFVLPAIIALRPQLFGIEAQASGPYPLAWQAATIGLLVSAPVAAVIQRVVQPVIPASLQLKARQAGWVCAALSAATRIYMINVNRPRPQRVLAADTTTPAGALLRILHWDALVFYITIVAWCVWISKRHRLRKTIGVIVYGFEAGFGLSLGMVLDVN